MKSTYILRILLIVGSAASCTQSDQIYLKPRGPLDGLWVGAIDTREIGKCNWPGWWDSERSEVQVRFTVSNTKVTAAPSGLGNSNTELAGSFDGDTVKITQVRGTYCDGGTSQRTYLSRYKGTIRNNVLSMTSIDTLCPTQGCISQRTLTLRRY